MAAASISYLVAAVDNSYLYTDKLKVNMDTHRPSECAGNKIYCSSWLQIVRKLVLAWQVSKRSNCELACLIDLFRLVYKTCIAKARSWQVQATAAAVAATSICGNGAYE